MYFVVIMAEFFFNIHSTLQNYPIGLKIVYKGIFLNLNSKTIKTIVGIRTVWLVGSGKYIYVFYILILMIHKVISVNKHKYFYLYNIIESK